MSRFFLAKKTVANKGGSLYHAGVVEQTEPAFANRLREPQHSAGPAFGFGLREPQPAAESPVTGCTEYAGQGSRAVQEMVLEYL